MTRPDPTDIARRMLAAAKQHDRDEFRFPHSTKAFYEWTDVATPDTITELAEAYLALQSRIDRALELLDEEYDDLVATASYREARAMGEPVPATDTTPYGSVPPSTLSRIWRKNRDLRAALTGADHD